MLGVCGTGHGFVALHFLEILRLRVIVFFSQQPNSLVLSHDAQWVMPAGKQSPCMTGMLLLWLSYCSTVPAQCITGKYHAQHNARTGHSKPGTSAHCLTRACTARTPSSYLASSFCQPVALAYGPAVC